jgi:hypothetical protein
MNTGNRGDAGSNDEDVDVVVDDRPCDVATALTAVSRATGTWHAD